MQAHRYGAMLAMIESGKLQPERLIGRTINLDQAIDALVELPDNNTPGITIVTEFA